MKSKLIIPIILIASIIPVIFLVTDYSLREHHKTNLQDVLFPQFVDYESSLFSRVDMQRSCAGYHVSEFTNVTKTQVEKSKILQRLVSGETGDGLPVDVVDTKIMLKLLEQTPDKFGKGEFGMNYEEKSYFIRYEFVNELKPYMDHVIGCYQDGLLNHFKNETVVKEFQNRYGEDIFLNANDDSVSFSDFNRDVYTARLRINFDEQFEISKTHMSCYQDEKDISYELSTQSEILRYLKNSHCFYDKFHM